MYLPLEFWLVDIRAAFVISDRVSDGHIRKCLFGLYRFCCPSELFVEGYPSLASVLY